MKSHEISHREIIGTVSTVDAWNVLEMSNFAKVNVLGNISTHLLYYEWLWTNTKETSFFAVYWNAEAVFHKQCIRGSRKVSPHTNQHHSTKSRSVKLGHHSLIIVCCISINVFTMIAVWRNGSYPHCVRNDDSIRPVEPFVPNENSDPESDSSISDNDASSFHLSLQEGKNVMHNNKVSFENCTTNTTEQSGECLSDEPPPINEEISVSASLK